MRIEVHQLPPVEYSLNWRGHWAERYQAGRVYGLAVFYSCVDARNRALVATATRTAAGTEYANREPGARLSLPFVKARLNLTFVFSEHRRRDRDNLLARFKPGLDGMVQSALVVDDDAEHLQISNVDILVDPERAPLTIIDIKENQWNEAK